MICFRVPEDGIPLPFYRNVCSCRERAEGAVPDKLKQWKPSLPSLVDFLKNYGKDQPEGFRGDPAGHAR